MTADAVQGRTGMLCEHCHVCVAENTGRSSNDRSEQVCQHDVRLSLQEGRKLRLIHYWVSLALSRTVRQEAHPT